MSDYEFTLPFPPSVNAWKTPFRGRMILTKKGREYRIAAFNAIDALGLAMSNITEPLSVELTLNPPTLRSYDCDNFAKSLLDALTHANFWQDDSQIQRLTIIKGEKTKGGNVLVKVNICAK